VRDIVVYYSHTGKTETAARAVAKVLSADLRCLKEKRGRRGLFGFLRSGYEATVGLQSELVDADYSLEGYDRVVLCQPLWASSATPAMNRFLARIDPRGRRFALLAVSGGGTAEAMLAKMTGSLEARGGKVIAKASLRGGMGPLPELEKSMVDEAERWAASLPR
jgi:hypothetical protein